MSINELLKSKVEEYIRWDPVESTREEIQRLLEKGKWEDLNRIIMSRLVFGTAGLRGRMGAGYTCMNDLVVLQTAQGLCDYLLQVFGDDAKTRGIVVGYDHRAFGSLSSKSFYEITVKVCMKKGIKVYAFNRFAFTPLVPYSISLYNCCAGIMITASHNPAADNGYKIYWQNACQIIPPHDAAIATAISQNLQPWSNYSLTTTDEVRIYITDITEESINQYIKNVVDVLHTNTSEINNKCPRIMYTAMHGVGYYYISQLFDHFELPPLDIVESQIHPDPLFPTVSFPNPEEKGALDIAMTIADEKGISYVMATDPDADRFIVCEKSNHIWHIFKGDEIGAIFGYYMCKYSQVIKKCMINSVVSSQLLLKIGTIFGVYCDQTLTGFKWMGNRQNELENDGYISMITYEEAIGYSVGGIIRDKDGVSAAAKMSEIICECVIEGRGLIDLLNEIYACCGYYCTRNNYIISHDSVYIRSIFDSLRNHGNYLFKFGPYLIKSIRDLTTGFDSNFPENAFRPKLPVDGSSQMITIVFMNDACLTLRTSGTEPKVKYYLEMMIRLIDVELGNDMEKVVRQVIFGIE